MKTHIALSLLAAGVAHAGVFTGSQQTITLDAEAFRTLDPQQVLDSASLQVQGGDTNWKTKQSADFLQREPDFFGATVEASIDSAFSTRDYTATGTIAAASVATPADPQNPIGFTLGADVTTAIRFTADNVATFSWDVFTKPTTASVLPDDGYATIKLEVVGGPVIFSESFYGSGPVQKVGDLLANTEYLFTMTTGLSGAGVFHYGQALDVSVVPEPGETTAVVALACAGGFLLFRRRSRR